MNLVWAKVTDAGVQLGGTTLAVSSEVLSEARSKGLSEVTVGFRPEDLQVGEGMAIRVEFVEQLGVDAYVHGVVETPHGEQNVVVRTDGRRPPHIGETVHVNIKDGHIHVFDSESGLRLGA
jgi:multiple sugar transport system ATP-binding protein